ncbi:MAG: hypothetical protein C0410_00745 [Anaerolinea sp.]|nr:hypothetical protein [Anaerolinea sp.]
MKHMKIFRVAIMVLFIIGLAACGQKGIGTQLNSDTSAQVSPVADTPSVDAPLSATVTVDGNALILEKLQNHHSIDRVYDANHTREEWNTTLDRMIGYGAKISEEEKQIIIDYLLSRK